LCVLGVVWSLMSLVGCWRKVVIGVDWGFVDKVESA
jgi:hypothetical protein